MDIYNTLIAISLSLIIPIHLFVAINLFKMIKLNKENIQCFTLLIVTIALLISYLIEKFLIWRG